MWLCMVSSREDRAMQVFLGAKYQIWSLGTQDWNKAKMAETLQKLAFVFCRVLD